MNANDTAAAVLQGEILEHIPLARAIGITIPRYTGATLEMSAPLPPNVNDKGCAFGGSMASLMTLAGWALLELGLRAAGLACDIYIGDSRLRYHEPVWSELRGVARLAEGARLGDLVEDVRGRGKGRVDVVCEIAGEHAAAATLDARFFAKLRKPA